MLKPITCFCDVYSRLSIVLLTWNSDFSAISVSHSRSSGWNEGLFPVDEEWFSCIIVFCYPFVHRKSVYVL